MNKVLIGILTTLMLCTPQVNILARGGDFAGGMAAGLVTGAIVTGVATSGSNKSDRAAEEARRAQDKTDQLRQAQEQERVAEMRRELDRTQMAQQSKSTNMMMIFVIVLMFLGILGLSILVLRKK